MPSALFENPDNVEVISENGSKRKMDSVKWWDSEKKDVYQRTIATIQTIENNQLYSQNRLSLYEQMYGDNRSGIGKASYMNRWQGAGINSTPRLSLNIVQSCIDTLASMISSDKPKPQFVPNEGDWKLYSKAKLATDYLEGAFDACKVYPLAQRMFTDACIYGLSGLYVNKKNNKLNVEYILRRDIIVDELDGHNEEPQQLHLKRFISKALLIKQYPEHQELIQSIPAVSDNQHSYLNSSVSDFITCVESWHLPTTPDAKDGKYALSVENCTLKFQEYNHLAYPIVFFRPYHKPDSFWGRGLVETLFTLQLALNELLRTIQLSQKLIAKPNWLIENGSMVNTDHINDRIGMIIEYTGTPPQCIAPEPMPQSAYSWVQYLEEHAYQISGISQSSASGQKPKGVESAVAMETVADIEAGRFENMSLSWNQFFMDLAQMMMTVSRDLYLENPKLAAKLNKQSVVRNIKWKDMDFDEDKFSIQLFPINRLPHDPAGRFDTIQRYIQAGWLDEIHGMSLLDMPDISEETSMMTGSLHLVDQMISSMLDDGEDVSPIPEMDLGTAVTRAKLAIVNATLKKYPQENIAKVVSFVSDCKDMQDFIQQQAMQAQAAMQPPPAPLAKPEPTPTSPMLPNPPPQGPPS